MDARLVAEQTALENGKLLKVNPHLFTTTGSHWAVAALPRGQENGNWPRSHHGAWPRCSEPDVEVHAEGMDLCCARLDIARRMSHFPSRAIRGKEFVASANGHVVSELVTDADEHL